MKEVYEGEVLDLTPEETENPFGGKWVGKEGRGRKERGLRNELELLVMEKGRGERGKERRGSSYSYILLFLGYGKTIAKVLVTLKTIKGTKQLRLDPRYFPSPPLPPSLLLKHQKPT